MHTTTESRQGFHINRNGHCYTLRSRHGCDLHRSTACACREREALKQRKYNIDETFIMGLL